MRARKRFGQHFLHDPAVIERIVSAIEPRAADHLVEIGAGRGALTRALLARNTASLDAVEVDRDLAQSLQAELAGTPSFTLHRADALEFDFAALSAARGARLRLVGNLPYNISTPLLFHLLASAAALRDMHVMLQREVAARITALPGGAEYGRLTVMLAPWIRAQRLFDVGPGAFQPAPRVWSAMLRLEVLREPAFAVSPRYAAIVAAAFSHRRKTLRNALKGFVSAAEIEACGLNPGARPETLPAAAYNALACAAETATAQASPAGQRMG